MQEDKPFFDQIFTFFVPGTPRPQGSKNAYRRGKKIVLVEQCKELSTWRETIADCARAANLPKHSGPVHLELGFAHTRPKSHLLRRNMPPHKVTRPDLDKCVRAVCDGLRDFFDDAQVVRITAWKFFGTNPGVTITVTEL